MTNIEFSIMFQQMLVNMVFYGVPLLVLLFFLVSLYRYFSAKRRNEAEPGAFSDEEMQRRKTLLKTSCTLVIILLAVLGGLAALFYMAIAYM